MNPIVFNGVHRAYQDQHVLRGLTFEVAPGEVFAMLGRNGAGKTTAIRILLGMLRPMAGSTAILGADSRALTGALRERIGFVSEGHRLEDARTVQRTLDYEAATRQRFDRAHAEDRLRRLDLPFGRKVRELSRGQQAQLALVLVLAGSPELLVFDDPGLGLDVVMRRELLDAIIELLSQEGVSVLFTSHVLPDVERLADRVGILHEGSLVVDATREELRSRVRQLYVRGAGGAPPSLTGLLGWRPVPDGFEVTLLDTTDEQLEAEGAVIGGSARAASLEELFVALTASHLGGPVSAPAAAVSTEEVKA